MKFQPEMSGSANMISRHEPGRVWIGASAWDRSVIVPWQGEALDWGLTGFDALSAAHFERLLALQPELVLFGSGARLRFPPRSYADFANWEVCLSQHAVADSDIMNEFSEF